MTNGFRSLTDIAGGLTDHLRGLGVFREVTAAGISSAIQLQEMVDTLGKLPGAVVCLGDITHAELSLSRQVRLVVAIADEYKRSTADKAGGIWPLLRAVENSFVPAYAEGESGVEIAGVEWSLEHIRPVETADRMTLFIAVVRGLEPLAFINEEPKE